MNDSEEHLDETAMLAMLLPDDRLVDVARHISRVSGEVTYPLETFQDLVDAVGGDDATFTIGNREVPVSLIRTVMPPYYFPITSRRNFVEKASYLVREAQAIESESNVFQRPISSLAPRTVTGARSQPLQAMLREHDTNH